MSNTKIVVFQTSTDEDMRWRITILGTEYAARDFVVYVRERGSNLQKLKLELGSGLIRTVEADRVHIDARVTRAAMATWARTEYETDITDETGGATRTVPIRVIYDEPGKLSGGISGNQATVSIDNNQAIVVAIGGVGLPGPANNLTIGDVDTLETGEQATASITGDAPNQELNLGLPKGDKGDKGWAPVFGLAADDERFVFVLTGWSGGEGPPPPVTSGGNLLYVGASGFTTIIDDAFDTRGQAGDKGDRGDKGWSPLLVAVPDGERRVLRVTDWVGGEGAKPATGDYLGNGALVPDIADAVDFRGPVGPGIGPSDFASQAEAEAASIADKAMSPLRTKQSLTVNAELADFTPAGTGSIVRTLRSKLRERVDVRDKGFDVSASAATNSVAIQNAIASVAVGGIVKIPPGLASVNTAGGAIGFPGSVAGVAIEGDGYSTALVANSATGPMFVVDDWYTTIAGVRIDSSVARTADAYIQVNDGANHFGMEHFNLNAGLIGIDLPRTLSVFRIKSGAITGIVPTYGVAIRVGELGTGSGVFDGKFDDILMTGGAGGLTPFAGMYVKACADIRCSGIQAVLCGQDIMLSPGAGDVISSFWMTNSMLDTAERGLYMNASAGNIVRARFDSIWSGSHNQECVRIEQSGSGVIDGVDFINPHFFDGAGDGVSIIGSGAKNIRFIGPAIAGNASVGLRIGSGVGDVSAHGGTIGATHGFGGNGTGVAMAGTNDNIFIKADSLAGNTTPYTLGGQLLSTTRAIDPAKGAITERTFTVAATTNGSGQITAPHGCIATPNYFFSDPFGGAFLKAQVISVDSTNFTFVVLDAAGAAVPNTAMTLWWRVKI